ncbi:hypothetical protein PR202_ga24195 [Eleusine coracana subsp. coracana]|uniref:Endoglucanase n=1 Tax=Eleusine coracana subsp. coracana TaxID=191504 RepID=A0AAV5D7R6_ELECO|nr:hypothetical protein PR202_ga24195 [Eleusine coracana subsp. coracana]
MAGANGIAAVLGLAVVLAAALHTACAAGGRHDYRKALSKSILYFEAQRSGQLPGSQRITWRANSGLLDGKANGVRNPMQCNRELDPNLHIFVDLVGGYYDAGDNVKFGLPMAFTVTMMSWSVLEYGEQMAAAGELGHAMEAVKWGTDYFLKAHPEPNVLYGEVGDGYSDHNCWQRPEDMTTSRQAYRLDPQHPGSDLAGETAAAMAAASLVFRRSNPGYANQLVQHSKQLFEFADKYRGRYDSSITVARNYYGSYSGYGDELLWAAAWLYQATNELHYLDYLANSADALGGTGWSINQFGWDVKYPGVQILAAKILLQGGKQAGGAHADVLRRYQQKADLFACACLGKAGATNVPRTPGGLMYHQRWNNIQFVTSASFLLASYSDHLAAARRAVKCPSGAGAAQPSELLALAKSQVDYILGSNPRATSYMVGYGTTYPQQAHHRGASIVSIKASPSFSLAHHHHHHEVAATAIKSDNQTSLPFPSHASPIEIDQNATASWTQSGKTYHRYAVTVTNRSGKTVHELHIGVSKLYGRLWGLDKARYGYVFPAWLTSLPAGKSASFVYIHAAPPADVWVTGYKLV